MPTPIKTSPGGIDTSKLGPYGCYCQTLHHRVVGDGCAICNPQMYEEIKRDNKKTQEEWDNDYLQHPKPGDDQS